MFNGQRNGAVLRCVGKKTGPVPVGTAASGKKEPVSDAPFIDILQRLESVLDEETAQLGRGKVVDLKQFSERKTQVLMDLSRLNRAVQPAGGDGRLKTVMTRLSDKMQANGAALRMHLEACQEITSVLTEAIRDSESDGTYTMGVVGRGARR